MSISTDDWNIKILADNLLFLCGDVWDDEEWDPAFDKVANHLVQVREECHKAETTWRAVLNKKDPVLAQMLVEKWASQGLHPPEEAYRILKKWYDHLQPVWDTLETDEPVNEIKLPPYVLDH